MAKIKMLARKKLLLVPFGLIVTLVLTACGYDTGTPTIPTQQQSTITTTPTDFGAGNFIRDGLISVLESFAHLMGFIGVGVLKWFIGTIEGFNLTREGSYRQCMTTFDTANPIDPLASCSIQVYDSFKFLPLAVLGVTLLYFLLKYTFQGIFRSSQLSITDFLSTVLITTVIAFNLDYLVTMVVDISSKLFLLILSSSGTTPTNFGDGIFAQLKDMGIAIAAIGFCLMALLAGVLLTFGGLNSRWKSQGFDILKYGLIGLLGIATLSLTIPALVDLLSTASGSTPPVSSGTAPIQDMDSHLNNLLKLFDLNSSIHNNDVGALLVMVLLTIPAMLSFLVIGVFFFIRVLLFLLFFLMGVPAVAARLTSETAFFFDVWWKGLLKLAATSLPIAIIIRIAIEVANSISGVGTNIIQYVVLMIIITLLFLMGGLYAVWIMKSEIRSAARNVVAVKQSIGQLKERYIPGNTSSTTSPVARDPKTNIGTRTPAVPGEKEKASGGSSDRFRQTPPTLPLTAQVVTQAISTGMTQAFQRQQATTDRQVGGALSQLSGIKIGLDELKGQQRQMSQTNPNHEVESLLRELVETTRRKRQEATMFQAGSTRARATRQLRPGGEVKREENGDATYSTFQPGGATSSAIPGRSRYRKRDARPMSTSGAYSYEVGGTTTDGGVATAARRGETSYNAPLPGNSRYRRSEGRPLIAAASRSVEGGGNRTSFPVGANGVQPGVDNISGANGAQPGGSPTQPRPQATRRNPRPISIGGDNPNTGGAASNNSTPANLNPGISNTLPSNSPGGVSLPPPPPPEAFSPQRPVYLPAERAWRRPDGGGRTSPRAATGAERGWTASATMVINPNTGMPYSGQGRRLKQQKAVNS